MELAWGRWMLGRGPTDDRWPREPSTTPSSSPPGVVKFTDYDMIVPMRPDPRYPFHHVFPHILYNSTPAAAHPPPGPPRLYAQG